MDIVYKLENLILDMQSETKRIQKRTKQELINEFKTNFINDYHNFKQVFTFQIPDDIFDDVIKSCFLIKSKVKKIPIDELNQILKDFYYDYYYALCYIW